MKYINTYKLFESNSEFSDIKSDLEDILLEVEDLDYKSRVDCFGEKDKIIQIDTSIHVKSYNNYLNINDIKDCIDRIISYMKSKKKFHNPNIYIQCDNEGDIDKEKVDLVRLYNNIYDIFEVKLKFRVRYHLMENINESNEYLDDIKDILLELEDDGFRTRLSTAKFDYLSENPMKFIAISNGLTLFEFVDIKDPLLRLREFIGESWISCSVLFQNSNDRIDIDINEKDYDKLDQWFGSDESHSTGILDIYIFFNI
jgi:hypothetical protein